MHRAACSWLALSLLAMPAAAQQSDELWTLLQAQTVMITLTFAGTEGQPENGSGVVLCQDGNQVYVLTAKHVVFGRTIGDTGDAVAPDVSSLAVRFFRNAAPQVIEKGTAQVISKQHAGPDRDLLLLTMPVQNALPMTATVGRAPQLGKDRGQDVQVLAVGFQQGTGQLRTGQRPQGEWAVTRGSFLGYDQGRLLHDAPITPGFSGGPLFDAAGALIGINVVSGGMAGTQTAAALPIQDVLDTIDKWLPGYCLQPVDTARDEAFEIYRQAMRAVGTKRWPEVERLMKEALAELPWEGGRVHLQGMRYTTFLPRYHLGLALYKQNHCAEALQEWGRSQVQRAIQHDKRFSTMQRLRNRCTKNLRRQLAAPAEVVKEQP